MTQKQTQKQFNLRCAWDELSISATGETNSAQLLHHIDEFVSEVELSHALPHQTIYGEKPLQKQAQTLLGWCELNEHSATRHRVWPSLHTVAKNLALCRVIHSKLPGTSNSSW
jgi:hypothetical protein